MPPRATRAALYVLFVTLCVLWLLWSGHYTVDLGVLFHASEHPGDDGHHAVNLQLVVLGLLSCGGVLWLCRRMGIVDNETIPAHLTSRVLRYLPWLAWQVFLANLEVIRRILRPARGDRPETVVAEGLQRTDVGRATYANSITLTPGTVTLEVTGSTFTVHALTRKSADGVYEGEMDRRVAEVEGLG